MKVTLITHTSEPEKLIASAAKLCYSPSDIGELMYDLTTEKISKFIKKLIELGHESPLEHVTFTFGIEGVSRALSHQLVRHRIASYSQKSQRYVNEEQFQYIKPKTFYKEKIRLEIPTHNEGECFVHNLDFDELMSVINQFYVKATEKGIPNEDARYVLPNACETKLICTMNVRSLLNLFEHRCCNRAQWEIRELANQMLELCKVISPLLFSKAGASCTHGRCKEGKMSCGKPIRKEVLIEQ